MTELAPGVHSLGHGKGGHVHAFLIDDGNERTLVDTLFEDDGRLVLEEIDRLGRRPSDLTRIAITHGHRSHLGGLAALKRASGATVCAHEWEADIVGGDRRAQSVTLLPKQSLRLFPFQVGLWLNRPRHVPCPVDETLDDGDAVGPLQARRCGGWRHSTLTSWESVTAIQSRTAPPTGSTSLSHSNPEGGRMSSTTTAAPSITRVAAHPTSAAGAHYRAGREHAARAAGFQARPDLNLHYFGGRTIEHLTFTNVYLGGKAAWSPDDVKQIDWALAAAMSDPHLNNVMAQYDADRKTSTAFKPSRFLKGPMPARVYRDVVEGFVAALDQSGALSGFDLSTTVFNFMLPRGVVLVDGNSKGHQERHESGEPHLNPALAAHDEAVDSKHGLGGYHGSIHAKRGSKTDTVLYAVGVYAEGTNGIVAFDKPWKCICATFYHELCEARTDPDVEDSIRAGDTPAGEKLLGWYSPKGGEIGDIPMDEAPTLGAVMKEVPLSSGGRTVPVQLMWSNAVGGPEGPIAKQHKRAART